MRCPYRNKVMRRSKTVGKYHDLVFPGESNAYRKARDELLGLEIELRRNLEKVAARRRQLPAGGKLKQDYVFEEGAQELNDTEALYSTKFSQLFENNKNSLVVYSFMFEPDAELPCPMCTSFLDSLNGTAQHARDRINIAVVAKAPIQKVRAFAATRDWVHLRLLSSCKNTYNADYLAENEAWGQMPAINVFSRTGGGIFHSYNTELLYAPSEENQDPRHADLLWPLWCLFDLTPDGRGSEWYPRISYD